MLGASAARACRPGGSIRTCRRATSLPCCCAGDGYVVIGSEDGQVRMFSETDKALSRAKTSIPGLGAPITSVDVTYDGKWVVATTKSYLMVIKTSYRVSGSACSPLHLVVSLLVLTWWHGLGCAAASALSNRKWCNCWVARACPEKHAAWCAGN